MRVTGWPPTVAERRRPRSIRARTTLAATAVAAIALLVASVALVGLLRRSLTGGIDDTVAARADDVARLVATGDVPHPLAVPGGEVALLQVVDSNGEVVAASENLDGEGPIADFPSRPLEPVTHTVSDLPIGSGDPFRVVAVTPAPPNTDVTVYAALSLRPVNESVRTLTGALTVGLPMLLALLAAITWIVVGRALHPVEALRSKVAEISSRTLDERVAVPPTGDEIAGLAVTMNGLLDRLETADRRQRRFVSDASHELKSPLSSSRMALEVALAHPERTDWPGAAHRLLEEQGRMERLVRDLLYLARAEERPNISPPGRVRLDHVAHDEVSRLHDNPAIDFDTTAIQAVTVNGSEEDLVGLVRNLLENAARHASKRVTVEVRDDTDDHWAVVVVSDDGPGISTDQRERVFERFARLDEARSRDLGSSGLGLAIARSIAEAHQGTLVIEDSPRGARFVARLPGTRTP